MNTKYHKHILAAVVSSATFLLYLRSTQNGFVDWDDNFYVTGNAYIRSFDVDFLRWAFFEFYAYNWHPLTWISHAVDYAIWGLNPVGHHLVNVVFHAANTFLVTILSIKLASCRKGVSGERGERGTGDPHYGLIAGTVAGALFGIHPLHVESVAWIAERKDLLCAFFFLSSVISYSAYVDDLARDPALEKTFSRVLSKNFLFSFLFFILAVLSKPMAVTLPVVLLILDSFSFGRIGHGKEVRPVATEKIPFLLVSLFSAIITILAQESGHAIWADIPVSTRMVVAAYALIAYILKIFFPVDLMPFYPYPRDATILSLKFGGALFLIAAVTYYGFHSLRKRKWFLFSWSYFVVTLMPVLGLIQVGGQFMADRYMYLPSVSVFIVIGCIFERFIYNHWYLSDNKYLRKICISLVVIAIASSLSFITYNQIGIWRNGVELWSYVIKIEPKKVLFAYYNRGSVYAKTGRYLEAIDDYSKVIAWNYQEYSKVYSQRGLVYLRVGKTDSAIADFEKACGLGDPFGCNALKMFQKK
jgi:hypothetical protein